MFLTPEQLVELTGRRRPSAQVRWLRENHWAYAVNADGHPRVAAAEAARQLETGGSRRSPAPPVEPDFTFFDKAG